MENWWLIWELVGEYMSENRYFIGDQACWYWAYEDSFFLRWLAPLAGSLRSPVTTRISNACANRNPRNGKRCART